MRSRLATRAAVAATLFLLGTAASGSRAEGPRFELHCDAILAADPELASVAHRLGAGRYRDISVTGASRISEEQLWNLVGDHDPDLRVRLHEQGFDGETAAILLARIFQSGLYAQATLAPGTAPGILSLELVENPLIKTAQLLGLRESEPAALLAAFVGTPIDSDPAGAEDASSLGFRVWRKRMDAPAAEPGCAAIAADSALFASFRDRQLTPGILRGGLAQARTRARSWLRARGYSQAVVHAAVDPDGRLELVIDEGRIISLEVRGVAPELRGEVEWTLRLGPGDLFSGQALRRAIERLRARYPFLELDTDRPGRYPTGANDERPLLAQLKEGRADLGDLFLSWRYRVASDEPAQAPPGNSAGDGLDDPGPPGAGNAVDWNAGRVVLWLRTHSATLDVDWAQLIRHTPATGFAPGLAATLRLWEPRDRARLSLDGAFAANSKRAARDVAAGSDPLEKLSAQEEVDGLVGARLAVPDLQLAELGGQLYALTDTNDSWRMSDLNSYVHSALAATADREYFRRAGATGLATFHLAEQLTLGGEYHLDRYDALPSPHVWSLANDGSAPAAAPVTPGRIGALLFRAEWSSDPIPLAQVGKLQRHPETSLAEHANEPGPLLLSLATLELAKPGLGSDAQFDYLKAISDSRLLLDLGHDVFLRTRLRVGLGNGLPLQKEEALGGWNGLRGYGFKEFRGDGSVLGSVEGRWRFAGAFVDVGAVHSGQGFTDPLPAVGAQLFLYRLGTIEAAWRLDGKGDLVPSARALLGWDI